jgi:aspartate/tyrosine/aromatic aminotransferase
MMDCLDKAPEGSIVLLHACAHNPSGVDPTQQQWKEIGELMKRRNLFTFFDSAYQGFASGDLEKDAYPIRLFHSMGLQMIVTQSFAKNFGLYGERIGAIHFTTKDTDVATRLESQLQVVIRPMYSNPPIHGALIVKKILGNPENFKEWENELKMVSKRIQDMRTLLFEELTKLKVKGNWDHIINQIGMFSFTGLTPKQCDVLTEKYHIYLVRNGRISMCGITTKNVAHLAKAMKDAVENH